MSFKHSLSKIYFMLTDYKGKSTRHSLSTSKHDRFSQVINGLVCLIANNRAFLCNVFTHETIALPDSNLRLSNWKYSSSLQPSYLFGFDPLTKEYKVLNIWTIGIIGHTSIHLFEVYTLGTTSWRRINPPAYKFSSPFNSHNQCICVNGVIYWLQNLEDYNKKYIELFDVKDEKFQQIPFPEGASVCATNLIQVQESLAVTYWPSITPNGFEIRMWILKRYHNPVWRQETIFIPQGHLTGILCPYPAGTIHTGEILIMDNVFSIPSRLLFYDLKSKNYRDITIYTYFLRLHEPPVVATQWIRFSHNIFKQCGEDDLLMLSISDHVENILPLRR